MGVRIKQTGFGPEFKRSLREQGPWRFTFYGFGECPPYRDNYVELDRDRVDAWGIPVLKIHCAYGENERAIQKDMAMAASEMLAAAGASEIQPFIDRDPPGLAVHEMGTAAWGAIRRLQS
jgi:hypothetical protein